MWEVWDPSTRAWEKMEGMQPIRDGSILLKKFSGWGILPDRCRQQF